MPTSSEAEVVLPDGATLHARPAAALVKQAAGFQARVTLRVGEKEADARSLLKLLTLGATGGTRVHVRAEGEDAAAAVAAIAALLRGGAE